MRHTRAAPCMMNYFAIPRCFASARHAAERSGTISAPLKFTGIESKRRKSGREPFPTGESFALQVVVSASSIAWRMHACRKRLLHSSGKVSSLCLSRACLGKRSFQKTFEIGITKRRRFLLTALQLSPFSEQSSSVHQQSSSCSERSRKPTTAILKSSLSFRGAPSAALTVACENACVQRCHTWVLVDTCGQRI